MITLYHSPQTRSSRIIWLLEELGAEYNIEYVTIRRRDGSTGADANNPHPYKQVPALKHGDALVTESAAVVLYLTDLYPKAELGPVVGDAKRGPYITWLAYYAGIIEPVMNFHYQELGDHPGLKGTFKGKDEVNARILGRLEAGPYILGDSFSAVDILVGSMGQFARDMLPSGEIVDDWLERLNRRAGLLRALAKDSPPTQ